MEELRRKLEGITADEELIGKILILFQNWLKEQVEGLEVIGHEEMKPAFIGGSWHPDTVAQAQLEDVKKQLRDKLNERSCSR